MAKNIKIIVKLLFYFENGGGGGGGSYLYVHLMDQKRSNPRGGILCLWCPKDELKPLSWHIQGTKNCQKHTRNDKIMVPQK